MYQRWSSSGGWAKIQKSGRQKQIANTSSAFFSRGFIMNPCLFLKSQLYSCDHQLSSSSGQSWGKWVITPFSNGCFFLYFAARGESKTTWHNIISFNPHVNQYLKTLEKGARVYVEANFELREPDPAADSDTAQGQRQIFLRHGQFLWLPVLSACPQYRV